MRVAMIALCLTAACDTATNQTFTGPVLATLNGSLTAGATYDGGTAAHLAIVWVSPLMTDGGVLALSAETTFPIEFSEVPPAHAAQGVLVAYQDLDGDGTLTLADKVVGASASALAHFDQNHSGTSTLIGFNASGYSVVTYQGLEPQRATPLGTTGVTIELTDDPWLALLSCPAFYRDFHASEKPCGLAVGP